MKNLKRTVSVIVVTILIVFFVNRISFILENKGSKEHYSDFFRETKDIDVLFLGSSHVMHGFFPMELWGDYGITAFNLAADGSTIPVSYWVLVNAMDYNTPKVVVLDIYDVCPRVISSGSGSVHEQMDAFPLSLNKIRMINDLYSEKNLTEETIESEAYDLFNKKYVLLWPFSEYHTRWNDLSLEDFLTRSELLQKSETWKGSSPLYGVAVREEKIYNKDISDLTYDDLSEEYLLKVIDLCKENNISLVLINTGYDCSEESKLFADSINDIAELNEVPYLDFTQMNLIDFNCDLADTGENTHVNFSGAQKFTSYIGEYIYENYDLINHKNEPGYEKWEYDYGLYVASKSYNLKQSGNITEFLVKMSDPDYKAIIEINDSQMFDDDILKSQLMSFGIEVDEYKNLIIIDVNSGKGECYSYEYNSIISTCIGDIEINKKDENDEYVLYKDGEKLLTNTDDKNVIRITVIDDNNVVAIRDFP